MRTRTNKIWSYQDLCFIGKNYATMTQFQLAYHFGVKETVMEACIRRYGFRKYKEKKHFRDELVQISVKE